MPPGGAREGPWGRLKRAKKRQAGAPRDKVVTDAAWGHLGAVLGPSWGSIGLSLGLVGAILGHLGALFKLSWSAKAVFTIFMAGPPPRPPPTAHRPPLTAQVRGRFQFQRFGSKGRFRFHRLLGGNRTGGSYTDPVRLPVPG